MFLASFLFFLYHPPDVLLLSSPKWKEREVAHFHLASRMTFALYHHLQDAKIESAEGQSRLGAILRNFRRIQHETVEKKFPVDLKGYSAMPCIDFLSLARSEKQFLRTKMVNPRVAEKYYNIIAVRNEVCLWLPYFTNHREATQLWVTDWRKSVFEECLRSSKTEKEFMALMRSGIGEINHVLWSMIKEEEKYFWREHRIHSPFRSKK